MNCSLTTDSTQNNKKHLKRTRPGKRARSTGVYGMDTMDEPLSALDSQSKAEILPYFERLSSHLSIPIILVSHDLSEVERLADYLIALRQGKVISSQPLFEALVDPELPFTQSIDSAALRSEERRVGKECNEH